MDICGEHGDDIAYSGRDCPACDHIERVRSDFKEDLDNQLADKQSEVDDLQSKLDEIEEAS